ncbi:universal stress protein [Streptomyces sp. NPDC001728]|uniref:universal stress protein n=1 Tax=Streptomyces sp. NPDC001728 TaxID=3154396 RepID=UPI003322660B
MSGLVIVGADGSTSSLGAVEAAAREARWRDAELRIVHAFHWPVARVPLWQALPMPTRDEIQRMSEGLVTAAVERARTVAPTVDVTHVVVRGAPVTVLEAQSRAAELSVVGSRGVGGLVGLMVGSTAVHLAAHGRCPVLVVRDQSEPAGPILLGADGSRAGSAAVDFAFAEAALRGAGLVALHAWTTWNAPVPPPQDPAEPYASAPGMLAEAEERLLAEALAGHRESYPEVPVELRLVHGPTREALIEASGAAQLLVVGARGRGGFAGLLLGSVSLAALHHAHCPVAVVRQPGPR